MPEQSPDRRRFVHVANEIRDAITRGDFKPGQRLPTILELSKQYGAATGTIQKAIDRLRDAGMVESWKGSHTYVLDTANDTEQRKTRPDMTERELIEVLFDRIDALQREVATLRQNLPSGDRQDRPPPA